MLIFQVLTSELLLQLTVTYGSVLSLTAFVKLVETDKVIGTHLCGASEAEVRITFRDNGWLAVFGEGVPYGGHKQHFEYIELYSHTQKQTAALH